MINRRYMKKFIRSSVLVCALAAGLALQGCGNKDSAKTDDVATTEASAVSTEDGETEEIPIGDTSADKAGEGDSSVEDAGAGDSIADGGSGDSAADGGTADGGSGDSVADGGTADGGSGDSADTGTTGSGSASKNDKKQKNGFDVSTAKETEYFGYKFQIPDYFPEPEYTESHDEYTFFIEKDKNVYFDMSSVKSNITRDEFESQLNDMPKYALEGREANITESDIITMDGHKAIRFDFDYVPEGSNVNASCRIYYFFDDVGKQLICIGFAQSDDSEYDYFSDIEKIVDGMSK